MFLYCRQCTIHAKDNWTHNSHNAARQQYLNVCRMAVLNDFEACGYGVPALQPEDLLVLNNVPAREKVCADCCCRTRLHENPFKGTAR